MKNIHVLSLFGQTDVQFDERMYENVSKKSLGRLYMVLRTSCRWRNMLPPVSGYLTGFHMFDVELKWEVGDE